MKLPSFLRMKDISVSSSIGNGWYPYKILEPFTGAWQQNIEWKRDTVLSHNTVFACITLIASDICKMPIKLTREDSNGIWKTIKNEYKVIERPNPYQNRIQFIENWIISKLSRGNSYILKSRDKNGNVIRMDVLHPDLVLPLITPDGDIYYQLTQDNLAGVSEVGVTVPASEIIHDRFNTLFHPLVGLSPIFAAGLAAYQGLKIQENSARHFKNGSKPGGIIVVPGSLPADKAAELKAAWEQGYSGDNYGKTAVLADGITYQPLMVNAVDSQMVDQLKLTSEMIASTFHVPFYKVGGPLPTFNNVEALQQEYFGQCLQILLEAIEALLDQGLKLEDDKGFEFDTDVLLRMDKKTQIETLGAGVSKAIYSPNEARARLNMGPVDGGESPMIQEQNYSLGALAKRDAKEDPFNKSSSQSATTVTDEQETEKSMIHILSMMEKEFKEVLHVTA